MHPLVVKSFRLIIALALLLGVLSVAQPSAAQSTVTLKYTSWMSKGEDKPTLAAFMKKYPNIKVEDAILDGLNYDQVLKPRMISGDAPDVFLFQPTQFGPYVKEGWLMDVSNEPGTAAMKQLKSLADWYTVNGKIYGALVNGAQSDQPFYYNKKYFAKLGIKPPTTVDELWALADKIKADGKDAFVFGGKDGWPIEFIFNRGYTATLTRTKWGANNPYLKLYNGEIKVADIVGASLQLWETMVKKGYVGPASQTLTYDQSVQYFIDGKAGILPQGPWIPGLDAIKKADPAAFELGVFAFPYEKVNGKIAVQGLPDRSIGIAANTKHPEEAKLLYNFFLSKEVLQPYLETQSLLTLTPGIDPKVDPALADFVKAHNDPNQYQVYIGYGDDSTINVPPAWDVEVTNAYVNILSGSTAADEIKRLEDVFAKLKGQISIAKK